MIRRLPVIVLSFALVTAACSFDSVLGSPAPGAPETTRAAADSTTGQPTTSTITLPDRSVDDCDDPTPEFELLCDAYDTIAQRFVDTVDDATLAAGAVRGIDEYGGTTGPIDDDDTSCHVPSDAFVGVCDALAAREIDEGLTDDSLIESAVRGMLDFGIGDPNTNYLDPEVFQDFTDSNNGQVEGIGSLVNTTNLENEEEPCAVISTTCQMVIVSPLPGSPSEDAGLRADDVITAVDGEPIDGMTLDEVVAIVRGPAGTDVDLMMARDGETFDVTITRQAIDVPILESEMLTDDVGYIRLVQFTFGSADAFRTALAELLDSGADTIIFDLQSNPGGSLDDAIGVASEFLAEGIVVTTEAPDQTIDYDVRPGGLATEGVELFVLVNGGSASASEVVAGALADAGRATLVGQTTFGKNTVQQQFPLGNGGALKVTIARWVTPAGRDFGLVGIEPNVVIEYPDDATFDFLRDEVLRRIQAGEL